MIGREGTISVTHTLGVPSQAHLLREVKLGRWQGVQLPAFDFLSEITAFDSFIIHQSGLVLVKKDLTEG